MTVSDASEIQLWPTGTPSFNTGQSGYTDNDNFKFYQRFISSGTRRLQVLGDSTEDHSLRLSILKAGVEIFTKDFTQTDDSIPAIPGTTSSITLPVLSSWLNYTINDVAWTLGASPNVTLPSNFPSTIIFKSYYLNCNYAFTSGYDYTINIGYTMVVNSGTSNPRTATLLILDNSFSTQFSTSQVASSGSNTISITFTATSSCSKIAFAFSSGSNVTITVNSRSGTETTPTIPAVPANYFLNSISFNPFDDYSITDDCLSFKVYDKDTTPDETEIFYSDEIDFIASADWQNALDIGRVDIDYKSIQNFAGLIYDNTSPYFRIQLDGRFRKERKTTTNKSIELTSMVLNTASSVKIQKKLSIMDVPDYMHTKIALILAHAASGSVLIDGTEISVEEAYEEGSDRPETYPLSPADINLTIKDSYKHNLI